MTMKRILALTAAAVLVALLPIGAAGAGEGTAVSHLNPYAIDGALFAREAGIYATVDVAQACAEHYATWRAGKAAVYEGMEAVASGAYDDQIAANDDAIAAGIDPPYPAVPPVGSTSEAQFAAGYMASVGLPGSLQDYLEAEWEPVLLTPDGVPCMGTGVLPAPPGGFVGIDLNDDPPPDPDPCPESGSLPFSPALWMWVPSWHENSPDPVNGGIYKVYDYGSGTVVFEWIPIVTGIELPQECLMIFPGDSASASFIEQLPAARLDVRPEGPGVTGLETLLWYQLDRPGLYQAGPITVLVEAAGAQFVLTGWAWIDAVGWDMDFDGASGVAATWDVWVDFPDGEWSPASPEVYAAMGGSQAAPAGTWVYESKDFYTVATGVSWRGFYQVQSIAGLVWNFTELYDPVTTWGITPYQVDELVGRVGED